MTSRQGSYGLDGLAIQAVSGPREKLQAVSDGSPTKWRRTRQDDSVESFDAAGRLIAVATRGPERIDIGYVDGLIHSVTDQQGRSLRFRHDAAGKMVAAELPDGQELVSNIHFGACCSRSSGPTAPFASLNMTIG